jgi:single-strand DNA-binding protein
MIAATVTGNVGKDATTREHDGKTVLSFTVASRRFEKGQEHTDWVDVSLWGERGKKLAQYVTKGSRIAARGTVWQREYEHQGQKRYSLTMRADDVELLGTKREDGGSDDAPF